MKNYPLLSTFATILGSFSLLTLAELKNPTYTFAQSADPICSPAYDLTTSQANCVFPAETYGVTIYQIAICKNNPLQNPTPNTSSCFFLYNNSLGQYVDIAKFLNSGFTLNRFDKDTRPPNGDYEYVYGLLSNRVDIKGSVTVQQGTYYTTSAKNPNHYEGSLASTNSSSYSVFDSPIWSETDSNDILVCFEPGNISYLDSNGQPMILDSNGMCTGATRHALAGTSQKALGSTIRITDDFKGLNMMFGASKGLGIYRSGDSLGNVSIIIDFQGFDFSLEVIR